VEEIYDGPGLKMIVGTVVAAERAQDTFDPLIYRQEDY
jgi:hypothetical protein